MGYMTDSAIFNKRRRYNNDCEIDYDEFWNGIRSAGEKIADQFAGIYKTMKGFKDSTFFVNYETGECGTLSLWESKEECEAAAAIMRPKLMEAAGGILKGPPTAKMFEVYQPKV
jgi:hypothetical protein